MFEGHVTVPTAHCRLQKNSTESENVRWSALVVFTFVDLFIANSEPNAKVGMHEQADLVEL